MAARAGEVDVWPARVARQERITLDTWVDVGATGAPTTTTDDSGVTVVRASAGTYNLTFPVAARSQGAKLYPAFRSVASTVSLFTITALNGTAGTATIVFKNLAGTATDPANGDAFWFTLSLDSFA